MVISRTLCVQYPPKAVRGHFGGSFPFSPQEGEPQPSGCLPTSPLHSLQQTFKKLKALLPAKGSEDEKTQALKVSLLSLHSYTTQTNHSGGEVEPMHRVR